MDIFTEDHLLICKRGGQKQREGGRGTVEGERKRERGGQKQRERGGRGMVEGEKKVCVRCEVSRKVRKI